MTNEQKIAETIRQILGNYNLKRAKEKAALKLAKEKVEFFKPYTVGLTHISSSVLLEELSKRDNVFIPYVETVEHRPKSQIVALKEALYKGNLMTKDGEKVLLREIEDAISKFCFNLF